MAEVQGPGRVLHDTPVQSLDALGTLAIGSILEKLELRATEALLLLEDGFIREGDFDGLELVTVEAGSALRELDDLRPRQVVSLDELGVENGVGRLRVQVGSAQVERNAAIEDNRALWHGPLGPGGIMTVLGDCESARGQEQGRKECLGEHHEWLQLDVCNEKNVGVVGACETVAGRVPLIHGVGVPGELVIASQACFIRTRTDT